MTDTDKVCEGGGQDWSHVANPAPPEQSRQQCGPARASTVRLQLSELGGDMLPLLRAIQLGVAGDSSTGHKDKICWFSCQCHTRNYVSVGL